MKKLLLCLLVISLLLIVQSCKKRTEKTLTFLTFNVWHEGTSVPNGLEKIRDVILETNPDVVCFVEVRNYNDQDWTTKIVEALAQTGKKYYKGYAGGDVSFISKYPLENGMQLFNNEDKGTVVSFDINIDENRIVVVGAHLDYTYYASYLPGAIMAVILIGK
jgi:exonuclease III